MLVLRKGCKVPFPEKLCEGYMLLNNKIIANISADKVRTVMEHFIGIHDEPIFFILELPSKLDDEKETRPGILEKTHKDIYYIDGCSQEEALAILLRTCDLMINDGLCSFGFGCHESKDEIMFGKYNVSTIFSNQIKQYEDFFTQHNITKTDNLITAWDTFTQDHPGISDHVKTDGQDVFSIPEQFADWGIYKVEQRED